MTARKTAAKLDVGSKAASSRTRTTARKSTKPSPEARIAALEDQVGQLAAQVDNLAKFIAAGVAQQLQAQLMGSPELQAHVAALAAQQSGQ